MQSSHGKNVKRKSRKIALARKRAKDSFPGIPEEKKKRSRVDWLKLEKYKANRLAGMNRFQAALKAGYAYNTARNQSHKYDKMAMVDIQRALEDAGATNRIMAKHIVDIAFNATKRQKCTVEIRTEDGKIVVDDQAVEVVPDLHLRKETWELIAKLKQQLRPMPVLPDGEFKRMILVVENTDNEPENNKQSDAETEFNPEAKRSVEVAD